MAQTVKCSKGHINSEGNNFCLTCGEKIGNTFTCEHCGKTTDAGAKFCGHCGKPTGGNVAAEIKGMKWKRAADDFALRVDTEDLPGVLQKGLVVEQGTKALLFINGALAETLQPGMYDLGGLLVKLRRFEPYRTATAILVDSGDLEFKFAINDVFTKDPLKIDISCSVVIQLDDPILFFNNVMKGRERYSVSEFKSALYDELQNAFNELIGNSSVTELNWDFSLKRQFEVSIENHLKITFQRYGLNFIQLRTIDYCFREYNKIRGIYEEVYLLVSEEEAKLQKRKRLYECFNEQQLQEIYEATKATDIYRKMSAAKIAQKWAETEDYSGLSEVRKAQARAEAADDLGVKGVAADKEIEEWILAAQTRKKIKEHILDKTKSDEEIEQFLTEVEKSKFLRSEELKELKRTYGEKDVDHELRRQFALKKLDLEQELEYESIRLLGKEGLEKDILKAQLEQRRLASEAEIDDIRFRSSAARQIKIDEAMAQLQIDLAQARTEAEKGKLKVEYDRLNHDNRLLTYAKMKAEKRKDEREKLLTQLEVEERRLKLKLDEAKALSQIEIDKINALSKASAEAVISMSGPEQAKLIQSLKLTEAMKGFSEDQILAMAAKDSPEVAKAFQEKYKNMSNDEREKFYKMLVEEKDKSSAEKERFITAFMSQSEREHIKSLDTAKEIAIGVAQSGKPQVAYPPNYGSAGFIRKVLVLGKLLSVKNVRRE